MTQVDVQVDEVNASHPAEAMHACWKEGVAVPPSSPATHHSGSMIWPSSFWKLSSLSSALLKMWRVSGAILVMMYLEKIDICMSQLSVLVLHACKNDAGTP